MPFATSIESILKPSAISAIRAATTGACEVLDPKSIRELPLTPARALTTEALTSLKSLLLNSDSWFFAVKRCLPRNTALFRMQGPQGDTTVLIDSCEGWAVLGRGERCGGFFDPVAGEVRMLLKSIYPELASRERRSLWKAGSLNQLQAAHSDVTKQDLKGQVSRAQ